VVGSSSAYHLGIGISMVNSAYTSQMDSRNEYLLGKNFA